MTADAPKDRPIIFSAPMVRALLDGRKSQTRRVIKPQPAARTACVEPHPEYREEWRAFTDGEPLHSFCLPYVPGDRLWVRETWRTAKSMDAWKPKKIEEACLESGYRRPWAPIQYEADGTRENFADEPSEPGKTRVAIHLPRWASRLTLIVTDVRVQRLQDIGDKDAIAEGVERVGDAWRHYLDPDHQLCALASASFCTLWNSLHGPDAWAANPWVVAVSFRTIKANIDSAEAKAA